MPEISIVMPVYNGEKYLKQSLNSIMDQTFKDWELIIVNDCSTDNSLQIMREYEKKDNRIHVICNEVNSKISKSLNNGFKMAKGKYFTWTSDDNMYVSDAFYKMHEYLEKNIDKIFVYSDMRFIDENNIETGVQVSKADDIFKSNCIGACFLYRSDVAERIGGYSDAYFLVEDYEYWLRIRQIGEIGHINAILYNYRRHSLSLSETKILQVRKKLFELRLNMIKKMDEMIPLDVKKDLFREMWLQDSSRHKELLNVFWNGKVPQDLYWLLHNRKYHPNKGVLLYGAGKFGKMALNHFGKENVVCYIDNNKNLENKKINGLRVYKFEKITKLSMDYQIVISTDTYLAGELAEELERVGITEYVTIIDVLTNYM